MAPLQLKCLITIVLLAVPSAALTNPTLWVTSPFNMAANNSILFSEPGKKFTLPIYIFDDEAANIPAGWVRIDWSYTKLTWRGQQFTPSGPFDPPDLTKATVTWGSPTDTTITQDWSYHGVRGAKFDLSIDDSLLNLPIIQEIPFAYRKVCFTPMTNATTSAATSDPGVNAGDWNTYCYRVYVYLKPRIVFTCPNPFGSTPTATPAPARYIPCPRRALRDITVIGVGQILEAFIYFEPLMRDGTATCAFCDRLNVTVLADPGIPNGATLGPPTGGPSADPALLQPADRTNLVYLARPGQTDPSRPEVSYLYSRKLTFRPTAAQLLTYTLRVSAPTAPAAPWGAAAAAVPAGGDPVTLSIRVEPPAPAVLEAASTLATLPATLRARCNYSFSLVLYETKEVGAVIDGLPADFPAAGYRSGTYRAVAAEDPSAPLPPGAVLSPPQDFVGRCADVPNAKCAAAAVPMTRQTVTWSPPRGTESGIYKFCLLLGDPSLEAGRVRRCGEWRVAKCAACLLPGDTLTSLAQAYGTSWMQLWGANLDAAPLDPGSVAAGPQPDQAAANAEAAAAAGAGAAAVPGAIRLGPTYVTTADSRPDLLARRFGMSLASLLAFNPDVAAAASAAASPAAARVPAGTPVCIVSQICA